MKKIIPLTFILIVILFGLSFNQKEEIKQSRKGFNVYLKSGDTYVKSSSNELPKGGYILNTTQSTCTNGGTITQDFNTRDLTVAVSGPDKCNFYFDEYRPNIVDVMNDNRYDSSSTDVIDEGTFGTGSSVCTNTVAYDGTADNNLRYVGADPCNYVTFNGETAGWRIVGIMNNVDDGTGVTETRIKLIRGSSLGDYSWDTSTSGVNGATSNYGINDWTQADLKNELNGDYLNTNLNANTMWYNGGSDQQSATFDYTKRLSAGAQELIGDAKWYLGGQEYSVYNLEGKGTTANFYEYERGNTVWGSKAGQTCNDGYCPRALEWIGKVALMYPSDYGYAVGGEVRSTCLGVNLNKYTYTSERCYNYDWMRKTNYPWFLSPSSVDATHVIFLGGNANISTYNAGGASAVMPTVYLNSSVTISGGNGTQSEPYVLE